VDERGASVVSSPLWFHAQKCYLLTYVLTYLPTYLLTYLLTLPCEQVLNQTSSEAHKFKLTALFLNRESDKAFFGG
jgi:hypothetical protein